MYRVCNVTLKDVCGQDSTQSLDFVNMAMDMWVSWRRGNLTSKVQFSRYRTEQALGDPEG